MCLLGYLVFGDVPRPAVVVGAGVVVASGFYLLMRERRSAVPHKA
jgi:drug/metabolite transporter (DMT)-like permease